MLITPGPNAHGSGPINVPVTDTGAPALQSTATVTLVVTPSSDSLTITDTGNQATNENTPLTFTVVLASDGLIACDAAHLSGTGTGLSFAFSGTPASCNVTVAPSLNPVGTVTVELTARDDALTATDTFDLVIATDRCLPTNDCEQRCTSVSEAVTCGCFPGFQLAGDGTSCDASAGVTLLSVGLGRFFDVTSTGAAPRALGLRAAGRSVVMGKVPGHKDTFTFTLSETPGTCADGSTSPLCGDEYRLCANTQGSVNAKAAWRSARVGTPSDWDSPLCAWLVTDLGGGNVRLKNQGLQQERPYFGYLTCAEPDLCGFTYDDAVTGNTTFRIAVEQCAAGTANCDTNATCTNTPAGAVRACNPHFAGNGNTCAPNDACLGDNGGCAQGCATAPDDTALCTCAPGFVLAPDQKACTPLSENRLYNTGLGLSLLLPKAQGAFWAPDGSNVIMAPLESTTDVYTFTVHAPGTSYRLCVHESGGFKALGLSWSPPRSGARRVGLTRLRLVRHGRRQRSRTPAERPP